MRIYKARLLCAGLGAFFLPACLEMGVRLVPEHPGDSQPTATVRRVAPEPNSTAMSKQPAMASPQMSPQQAVLMAQAQQAMAQQQVAMQPQQPNMTTQQVMVQVPGMQPIQGPNGEWLMPVQMMNAPMQSNTTQSGVAQASAVQQSGMVQQAARVVDESNVMVAITHTGEPPLASNVTTTTPVATVTASAKAITEPVAQALPTPPAPPKMLPQLAFENPGSYPPGYQVLLLQPNATEAKQAGYQTTEANPNLLTPTSPPEELKLVTPKASECGTLKCVVQSVQDRAQSADPVEVAEVVDQLQQVITTLRAKAALRIEKLCYCRPPAKPARYGVFQPLPDDHAFHTGESVEVYMELRNFSCESKDREHTMRLSTVLEVCDERGTVVSRYEFERDRADVGTAPRNEYFHICRFPVQGLAAGKYMLNAKITDMPTGRTAEKTLPLIVEPARRVARGTAD